MAAFVIYATHFLVDFHPEYEYFFDEGVTSWFLNGVSGKLCVAFFGVCLGYFAYLSKEKNPTKYIMRRYFYFFFCGLLINTIISLYRILNGRQGFDLFTVLVTSLSLGDKIYPTYWCIVPFFLASVLSYINGQAKVSCTGILFQIVFLYILDEEWISICLLGAVAAVIINNHIPIFKNWLVKFFITAVIFFAIKRPESKETFLLNGLCSAALLIVVENSSSLQKILSVPFFANQGKNVMAIFLIHPLIYTILGNYLMNKYYLPYGIRFLVTMTICWIVIILISYPLTSLINKTMDLFNRQLVRYVKET